MNINNKEVLLWQFADGTTLCLDGSEESFYESIQTLKKYALIFWIENQWWKDPGSME